MSGRNFITAAISTAGFILSAPATRTTTVTGAAVDILNVDGPMLVVQHVGTVTGTTPTLDGKLQDSADGSTGWADITGATFTQVTASNSKQKITIPAGSVAGWIRYVGTIAGTTPSFILSVTGLSRKETV